MEKKYTPNFSWTKPRKRIASQFEIKDKKPPNENIEEDKNYIWVKDGYKKVQICLQEIMIVNAVKDYMEVQLANEKVLVNITMTRMESYLHPPQFLRVSRSCIIKKNIIKSIQDMHIETTLPHFKRISIGDSYWEGIKKYITEMG